MSSTGPAWTVATATAAAEATAPIGVDPDFQQRDDDNDSRVDDSGTLTSESLNSRVLQYRKLYGRTFQNFEGVDYWAPNDDSQNEGLDIAHHMLFLALGNKLHLAPLENPQKVLDVGTGTGIWAIDFSEVFPSAEVIGTDISPIQPSWVPPNCKFELDNCELDWTFDDNTFDYIHIRCLLGCVSDWAKVYRECLRCLKPGGWLEHTDYSIILQSEDDSVGPDHVYSRWTKTFKEAGDKMGRTFNITDNNAFVAHMEAAGFADVHVHHFKLPIGPWPADPVLKEIGVFAKATNERSLEGFALYVCTSVLGQEYAEVQDLVEEFRQAMNNKAVHGWFPLGTAWTQKPKA